MSRIRVFVAIAAVVIVGGALAAFAVTARSGGDPGVPIVAADEPTTSSTAHDDPSITTTSWEGSHDTTSTTEAHEHHDSTTTTEFHEPSTTIPHEATTSTTTESHEPTTTTTTDAPPAPTSALHLACATPAHDGGPSSVVCEWNDPPPHTTRWVLMREQTGPSQPLWETTDLGVRRHVDDSAEAGVSYAYRVSAYNGETFLVTSNPVRLVAGGEG
jgi:hypothetical protein